MPARPAPAPRTIGLVALALAALAVAVELARPIRTASVAFDSQVAVVHFQRLVEGRQLEAFVSTTPKPFLTALFGPLQTLTGDWRPLAWATIAAFVVAVLLAARLAERVAGPVAGAFAGAAVLVAPAILFDVGFALATPWALCLWLAAGLLLAGRAPRWGLAGLCLALATLARVETLVVVGLALAAMAWGSFAPERLVPGGRPSRRAWLVPLVGLLALPVMLVHDLLLTGDPLFWTTVAERYSEATRLHVMTPVETIAFLAGRYWSLGGILLLGLIGLVRTWRAGHRAIALGLIALGPGIAAFLVLLAVRGIYVSDRYAAPIDAALAVSAGIGFGTVWDVLAPTAAGWLGRLGRWRDALVVGGATVVAAVLMGPYWVVDPTLRPAVQRSLRLALDADRAAPVVRAAVDPTLDGPALLVPLPIRPRMAVETDLALTELAGTDPAAIDVAGGTPAVGQLIVHSAAGDPDLPAFADLETDRERAVGGVTVEPLLADAERGLWVIRIR